MPKPPPKYVSLRQLAKRLDVSAAAVSQGLRRGRIEKALRWVHGRPIIVDADLAEQEWRASQDPMMRRDWP